MKGCHQRGLTQDSGVTIGRTLAPQIIVITASTVVIVEGYAMFAEKYLQRRYREGHLKGREEGQVEGREKGRAEGLALAHEAWDAWYQRLLAAQTEGRPVDEPPPNGALQEEKIGAKGTGCAMFAEKYLQRCYREGRQNDREEGRAEGLEKGLALANEARGAWYQRLLAAPSEGRPSTSRCPTIVCEKRTADTSDKLLMLPPRLLEANKKTATKAVFFDWLGNGRGGQI